MSNVKDMLTGGRYKGRSRDWKRLGLMTGVCDALKTRERHALYLRQNIDQAAVRPALLAVGLTPAPTGRCGVTTARVLRSRMRLTSHVRF